jgi:pyruvate kinase
LGITLPKTKVVCTIGPACETPETIRELISNGMSIARLNFSHGTHQDHGKKIQIIRKIANELDKPVAILQDLGGPKIRIGHIPDPGVRIDPGQSMILTTRTVEGSNQCISVSYPLLNEEVKANDRILLADGFLELRVRRVDGSDIHCEVITGGVLTSFKGINLPSSTIKMPSITDKDYAVMLSEETATGNYPVQALRYMIRIITEAEKTYPHDRYLKMAPEKEISDAVSYAVCVLADHLDVAAILAPTKSGRTARHLSRFRPKQPILAFTPDRATMRQLSLYRGIYSRTIQNLKDTDEIVETVSRRALDAKDVSEEDLIIITAGQPVWTAGMTNMIQVKRCQSVK